MSIYKVIGQMSGTSLDGVDLAYCSFWKENNQWHFTLDKFQTFPYPDIWIKRLSHADQSTALDFVKLHTDYAHLLAGYISQFIQSNDLTPDFAAIHGHTVFHQPHLGFTTQIGCGATLAAQLQLSVVCDFRSMDVALGGQGAPLVPIGDALLFGKYAFCLNLGGFSNISYNNQNNERIAFDICPVNIILNYFSQKMGIPYDKDGMLAAQGKIHTELLDQLNSLSYYHQSAPKSLGKEWVVSDFLPIIESYNLSISDILATLCEHIAIQIAHVLNKQKITGSALVTGGGAYNHFLIQQIQSKVCHFLEIPDTAIIDFKEALIFAFLGVLRKENIPNCLKSVTGASRNHCSGAIY